jgi:hypothetical protein
MFGVKPPLSIGIASVSDDADINEALVVIDGVDYAVISDSDSPQIGSSLQLDAAGRPWIG